MHDMVGNLSPEFPLLKNEANVAEFTPQCLHLYYMYILKEMSAQLTTHSMHDLTRGALSLKAGLESQK